MLLVVAALHALPTAHAEPRLSGPDAPLDSGAAATFTFVSGPDGALVDGCAAVELERLDGGRWLPTEGGTACDGTALARAVAGSLTITVATPGDGEFRGALAAGSGCVEGRSFATSACKAVSVVRSAPFTVGPVPAPPQR